MPICERRVWVELQAVVNHLVDVGEEGIPVDVVLLPQAQRNRLQINWVLDDAVVSRSILLLMT